MLKFDLHVHSNHSPCSNNNIHKILKKAERLRFDFIFITDHNSVSFHKSFSHPKVLPGTEILTNKGEIIGLYVQEKIPEGLSVKETIEEIHEQGGLAIAAHPLDPLRKGIRNFWEYKFDAVEVLNARIQSWSIVNNTKRKAQGFVHVAGSDAHFIQEFGETYNVSEYEPYEAIKKGKIFYKGKLNRVYPHILSAIHKYGYAKGSIRLVKKIIKNMIV